MDNTRPLTEGFIRELNRTILEENFWKAAKTPNGEDTCMEVQVGPQPFNCNYNVEITLSQLYYEIGMSVFNQETKSNDYKIIVEKRLHHKPLTETEKEQIVRLWIDSLFNFFD